MDNDNISLLVKKCKKGNIKAYESLIDLYGKSIFNIIYKMTSNYHDSNDLTQEVYIKIYKNISKFNEESSFWTWVYKIAINICKDYYRKQNRFNEESLNNENEDGKVIEIIDNNNYIEDILIQKYELQKISNAVNLLNFNHKEIILLKDIYNYSYIEISAMLEISEGTVKSRLNRAREKLKIILLNMEQN